MVPFARRSGHFSGPSPMLQSPFLHSRAGVPRAQAARPLMNLRRKTPGWFTLGFCGLANTDQVTRVRDGRGDDPKTSRAIYMRSPLAISGASDRRTSNKPPGMRGVADPARLPDRVLAKVRIGKDCVHGGPRTRSRRRPLVAREDLDGQPWTLVDGQDRGLGLHVDGAAGGTRDLPRKHAGENALVWLKFRSLLRARQACMVRLGGGPGS